MIIVKLWGGLGNQLFQYCFGKNLSEKLNTELKFDNKTSDFSKSCTERSIAITDFNIDLSFAEESEIKKHKRFVKGFMSRIERKIIQRYPYLNRQYLVERSDLKRLNFNNFNDNCYYDGYWQFERYISPYIYDFSSNLVLREGLIKKAKNESNTIQESNSVSIHIRRGDYVSIKKNSTRLGVCSIEYYENAIRYIEKQIKNPCFYIFTDDYCWVSKHFNGDKFRIIRNTQPSIDLVLMSKCKHNIIANSTFSWWAARLNGNKGKIIIATKKWYNCKKLNSATIGLIPTEWIRL